MAARIVVTEFVSLDGAMEAPEAGAPGQYRRHHCRAVIARAHVRDVHFFEREDGPSPRPDLWDSDRGGCSVE
jgi:hypothetical protein